MVWPFDRKTRGLVKELRGHIAEQMNSPSGKADMKRAVRDAMESRVENLTDKLVKNELAVAEKAFDKEAKKILQGGFFKRNLRRAGIGAAVVGGIAALGIVASSLRRNNSRVPVNNDMSDLDALEAGLPPLDTGASVGPADGRAPGEWQRRVRPDGPVIGPNQPSMTAVPSESVQDLNAPSRA